MARSLNSYPGNGSIERKLRRKGLDPLLTETTSQIMQADRILRGWAEDVDELDDWSADDIDLEHVRIHRIGEERGVDFDHSHGDFRRELWG